MMSSALATVAMVTMVASVYGQNEFPPKWESGTQGFTAEQIETVVAKHNEYRGMEKASDMNTLTWSDELTTSAQAAADTCTFEHTENRGNVGENIAVGGTTWFRVDQFVTMWWDEIKDFTFSTNTCGDGKVCGHYTAVVWGTTTKVGCGVRYCDEINGWGKNSGWIVFCQYNPAGNWVGEKPFTCAESPDSACDYVAPPVVIDMVMPDAACKKRDYGENMAYSQKAVTCGGTTTGCDYLYCDDGTGCKGQPDNMAGIPCDQGKICIADKAGTLQCEDDPTGKSDSMTSGCLWGDQVTWCSSYSKACDDYSSYCCASCPQ